MKVHLVFAPSFSQFEVLLENLWPPLGALYLASYLRARVPGVEVKVTDGCRIGYENTLKEIRRFAPDIVGISFYTTGAYGAFRLTQDLKKEFPAMTVVLGGVHATALPEESLNASGADMVVSGEGEEVLCRIVKARLAGKSNAECRDIPGVGMKLDGVFAGNAPHKFISPLEDIPVPAWDLIDLKAYKGWYLTKRTPEMEMLFSRGCPYNCSFCSNIVWKSSAPALRLRSAKDIVDEMESLNKKHGINEIFDVSDELNNSIPHALEICREIKKRNLGIAWKTQLRVQPVTEELAAALAESGCWSVHLGIESGNQATIDGVEKCIRISEIENTCRILKKHNIRIFALLMLFNVWEKDGALRYEGAAETDNTLNFAWDLVRRGLIDYIGSSVTTPYPGSRLYDIALRHNIIKPSYLKNWEKWQTDSLFVLNLPGVEDKDRRRIKLKGEFIRVFCLLKNQGFKWKDIIVFAKRAIHTTFRTIIQN